MRLFTGWPECALRAQWSLGVKWVPFNVLICTSEGSCPIYKAVNFIFPLNTWTMLYHHKTLMERLAENSRLMVVGRPFGPVVSRAWLNHRSLSCSWTTCVLLSSVLCGRWQNTLLFFVPPDDDGDDDDDDLVTFPVYLKARTETRKKNTTYASVECVSRQKCVKP